MTFISISVFLLVAGCLCAGNEESRDTREGENVTLQCRFNPPSNTGELTYYWVRTNPVHDNAAVGASSLDKNYK